MRSRFLVGFVFLASFATTAGPVAAVSGEARNVCIADCQRQNFECLGTTCCVASGGVITDAPPNMQGEGGCDRSKAKPDESVEKQYARCKQECMAVRDTCVSACFKADQSGGSQLK